MESPAAIPPVPKVRFEPKETVTVVIGKISVHLYPDIHPLMPVAEKAHGYHVTTTSLKGARLAPDVYVDHLGMHLDSTSLVAGLKQDFMDRFDEHWLDWNNLTILSFHNTQGQAFGNNAVTPADLSVLKPVVNGAVANCRPADVRFVRVECTLDFRTLCTAAEPTDNTTLRCSYYIELPQSTVVVNDGNNNPRNLRTWQGVADLRTLSVEEMGTHIISQTPQDCPVMLQEHDAYVTNARIDDSSAMEEITRAILKLSIPTIKKSIFKTLCPNYTNKPHAAVEGLQQTSYDDEGNVNVHPFANFFSVLMRAIQPFAHMKETFPVNESMSVTSFTVACMKISRLCLRNFIPTILTQSLLMAAPNVTRYRLSCLMLRWLRTVFLPSNACIQECMELPSSLVGLMLVRRRGLLLNTIPLLERLLSHPTTALPPLLVPLLPVGRLPSNLVRISVALDVVLVITLSPFALIRMFLLLRNVQRRNLMPFERSFVLGRSVV